MLEFNDALGAYTFETNGIIFSWDEEPQENYENTAQIIAENYKTHLSKIIDFMLPDLKEVYGDLESGEVEEKLGKPIINIELGQVTYCEQLFDDVHIFSFEFLDNEFEKLQFFSIDG